MRAPRVWRTVFQGLGCITIALAAAGCGGSDELQQVKTKDVRTNPDNKSETAEKLQDAVTAKNFDEVKRCIGKRANPNIPLGSREETSVHLAVREGTPEILSYLLSNGGKTDTENRDRQTPLIVAIDLGKLDFVKILLNAGSPANGNPMPDRNAASRDTSDDGTPEPRRKRPLIPLFVAAKKNRLEILKLLVDNGAEADKVDGQRRNVIFYAAEGADEETMKYVLGLGQDINALDRQDGTALMAAAEADNVPAIKVLVAEGADVNNPKDKAGRTALMCAKMKRKEAAVKALTELGAKEE